MPASARLMASHVMRARRPIATRPHARRQLFCALIFVPLLTMALAASAGAQESDSGATDEGVGGEPCAAIYSDNDPRLFDFINTYKAVDLPSHEGKLITRITVVPLPIFNEGDADENNALYRAVNRLHILTRSDTVRRQLLIKTGDRLSADRIHESERILRGANYLYDAMIIPGRICGDTVELLVVVRDIWTLQPTASFHRTGGNNSTSIGISDDNILGYGHGLSLSYDKDASRHGVVLGYNSSNLFDGHTQLAVSHTKNNDGQDNAFSLARPFYALDTRWSAGGSVRNNDQKETIASGGITSNVYDHQQQEGELFFGLSAGLHNDVARRLRIGVTRDNNRYDNQDAAYTAPLPADRLLTYHWLEYESIENNFWTTSNLSQLFRNEDINTGTTLRVRVGATSGLLGSNTDELIADVEYNNTVSFGAHHLLQNHISANARWDEHGRQFIDTLYGYLANYDFFIDDNDRWHAFLSIDAGENLTVEHQLTAGGDSHLRGYPDQWQRGDRRIVANIERRHFFNAHPLHLFRLGGAVFAEAGKAWDSTGATLQSDHVLSDIGVGLRINSSKARPTHVIHVNVAFPLKERDTAGSYQWSVYSETSF